MQIISRMLAPVAFMLAYLMFRIPLFRASRTGHDRVMKLFRFAADNGSRRALSLYGHLLHFRGEGVENRIQGGIYLQRAAEKGDSKASYQMGRIYEQGFEHYFQPDPVKALAYYRQAAEQSHLLAIRRLVEVFAKGELEQAVDTEVADQWRARLPSL
ncbi:tetratricopeptide repeat protein [Neptuniibacter halophilus]|uniref:tetratricopeptide repeat protein n=1 Tax=Neptuniibacter halophilus TaxID=651666 RepID=UPI00257368BF|nr:sel1 repeat family protein [Neptuniibacter halophilus]